MHRKPVGAFFITPQVDRMRRERGFLGIRATQGVIFADCWQFSNSWMSLLNNLAYWTSRGVYSFPGYRYLMSRELSSVRPNVIAVSKMIRSAGSIFRAVTNRPSATTRPPDSNAWESSQWPKNLRRYWNHDSLTHSAELSFTKDQDVVTKSTVLNHSPNRWKWTV